MFGNFFQNRLICEFKINFSIIFHILWKSYVILFYNKIAKNLICIQSIQKNYFNTR